MAWTRMQAVATTILRSHAAMNRRAFSKTLLAIGATCLAPELSFSQERRGAVRMKITDVETIPVSRYLFVRIHTNEGITGLGESGTWGFLEASEKAVEDRKSVV